METADFFYNEKEKAKNLSKLWHKDLSNGLTCIDLFCGCGGLSLGFKRSGYKILVGIDHNKDAILTYSSNKISEYALDLDLQSPDWMESLQNLIKTDYADIVIAGPPCQGFSLTGPRKLDDPRNKLYLSVVDLVENWQPKAFLIENVKGIWSLYGGDIREEIKELLNSKGYKTKCMILNSANYGVPQLRERVFFIGIRKDLEPFMFPDPILNKNDFVTCQEALDDLPSLDKQLSSFSYESVPDSFYQRKIRGRSKTVHNHYATKHKEHVIEVIRQVPDGGDHKDLPAGVGSSRNFNEAWTRYSSKKPSKTIDTGHRNHFHYKHNRVPTVRENARLQSFPDSFRFLGSRTSQYKQVGNAVPVMLAKALADKLKEKLL